MTHSTRSRTPLLAALTAAGFALPATAAWTPIDTFEGLTAGNIDGQNGWQSVPVSGNTGWSTLVAADPVNGANQVLQVSTTDGSSQGSVGKTGYNIASTPDAAPTYDSISGTLFFRARYNGQARTAVGMSDLATINASSFGDYETQVQFNGGSFSSPRVRDGSSFEALSPVMQADTWYNVWFTIDNTGTAGQSGNSDGYRVYMQSDDDPALSTLTQVSTDTTLFRGFTNNTNPLQTFILKGGSSNTGTVWIDDVYIDETGENLFNPSVTPIPEPASIALLAAGLLMTTRRRR